MLGESDLPPVVAQTVTSRPGWERRAGGTLFILAIIWMQATFFTAFWVPEEDYWLPVLNNLTWADRHVSLGAAVLCNAGLILAPRWRDPGGTARLALSLSLLAGFLVSSYFVTSMFAEMQLWPLLPSGQLDLGGIFLLLGRLFLYGMYGTAAWLYLKHLKRLVMA